MFIFQLLALFVENLSRHLDNLMMDRVLSVTEILWIRTVFWLACAHGMFSRMKCQIMKIYDFISYVHVHVSSWLLKTSKASKNRQKKMNIQLILILAKIMDSVVQVKEKKSCSNWLCLQLRLVWGHRTHCIKARWVCRGNLNKNRIDSNQKKIQLFWST